MLSQKLLAHARLVIHAAERRFRGDLYEVAIALVVLCQHQQMVIFIAFRSRTMIIFLTYVKLAADDRLNSCVLGCVMEGNRPKNVAVIRHGNRRLPELSHALNQLVYIAGAVEKRIIGMKM